MDGEDTTLSMAMSKAYERGYKDEFRLKDGKMTLGDDPQGYRPEDLLIKKFYRFEGESNPDDMAVLYLIHTNDDRKGILVDAFGAYGSQSIGDFLKQVKMDKDLEGR